MLNGLAKPVCIIYATEKNLPPPFTELNMMLKLEDVFQNLCCDPPLSCGSFEGVARRLPRKKIKHLTKCNLERVSLYPTAPSFSIILTGFISLGESTGLPLLVSDFDPE